MKSNTLKLLIGVSASGKSTWAKDFVSRNDKWCIVSRDDYRYAWQNKGVVSPKLEELITLQVKNSIQSLIGAGYNVLYDATNLKASYIKQIADYVKHTANVEFQIFDVPKDVCLQRDALRERKVGADVIDRQFKDFLNLLDSFDFKPIAPKAMKYNRPDFDYRKTDCIIVDIDGTLAHTSGKRNHYDMTKVELDEHDVVIKRLVNTLSSRFKVIIVTGRDEFCRSQTQQWLSDNGINHDKLLMRKDDDKRKDSIIKEEIFWNDIEPHFNVFCVLDDRDQVVKMWRDLGIKCLQVEYGNF